MAITLKNLNELWESVCASKPPGAVFMAKPDNVTDTEWEERLDASGLDWKYVTKEEFKNEIGG